MEGENIITQTKVRPENGARREGEANAIAPTPPGEENIGEGGGVRFRRNELGW